MTGLPKKHSFESPKDSVTISWKKKISVFYTKIISTFELLADFLTIFLSFTLGADFFSNLFHHAPSRPHEFFHLGVFAALFSVFIFERKGLYKQQLSLMNIIETRKIIHSFMILFPVLFAYSFVNLSVSNKVLVSSLSLAFFIMLFERMFLFKFQQYLHLIGINEKQVVIVGADEVGRTLFQGILQSPKLGYRVLGFFDEDQKPLNITKDLYHTKENNLFFESDLERLGNMLVQIEKIEVFIALPNLPFQKMEKLVTFLTQKGATVRYVPYMYGHFIEHIRIMEINGIPLFSTGNFEINVSEQILKRIFDLVLSITAIIVLAPVFLILIFLIKKYSPGSIFFKQTRVGKNGKPFEIYKFRTMHMDAPAYSKTPSSSNDPRITSIGRMLRKTSLDELPQLFNVIRGEMSLVGPRPEMPFLVDEYNALQRERLLVKPGITGVWQISANRQQPIHENMAYDIFYIKNRSLLLDIIVLCRTLIWGIAAMKTH